MTDDTIVHEVCRLFPQIFQCFYRRTEVRSWRPSLESLAVLQHLLAIGPMTVTEACLHFDRSQASMSEIFSRLEARGLLDRVQDAKDRRRSLLWLSAEGQKVLAESNKILDPDLLEPAIARMSQAECQQLLQGMNALLRSAASTHRRKDT